MGRVEQPNTHPICETTEVFQQCERCKRGYNADLIFASSSIDKMCVKSVLNPILRTQYRPICVTVNPVLVSRSTAFRRRFKLRNANWSGSQQTLISLLMKLTLLQRTTRGLIKPYVTSMKHIPKGCRSHYIPEESKSLYEAYKKQYMSNPFDSTTLDADNEKISMMSAKNRKRWEEMIASTYLSGNSQNAWQTIRKIITTQQLQNHLVWSLLTKLHTNCSSTADERCQQSALN